ncbi:MULTISPECIES: hypothetical protein [unclassified Paenibacillus]|uniref:hypothetical protein n=1 Tax=unclassified Paenibacillus TaxID=185978 RepID=UPI000CFB2F40|nr:MULTISPECIES: hypothetical protein [unclassified Paenibacillus]PQZ97238.1 hypothetical protein CQ043_30740 [Paenibacillus sp. MYb63]PRA41274.1 hypothetical protein CQ061_30580 [Paenibacillus sp. MYb67]
MFTCIFRGVNGIEIPFKALWLLVLSHVVDWILKLVRGKMLVVKWANRMAVSLAFEAAVDSAEGVGGYTDSSL